MKIKKCDTCGRFLGEGAFYWNNKEKTRLMIHCKKCHNRRAYKPTGQSVGRPKGCKHTEATKKKMSKSKQGQKHSEETKDKISATLLEYFKGKYTLSEELLREYKYSPDFKEVQKFIEENRDELNDDENIISEQRLKSIRVNYETPFGDMIEQMAVSDLSPEKLLMIKQALERGED